MEDILNGGIRINGPGAVEVIVKYNGDIMELEDALEAEIEILSNSYAIVTINADNVSRLLTYSQIEAVELPKILTPSIIVSKERSCINPVQSPSGYNLSGRGVIVAIIDSGIQYTHRDFRNPDGTTRILYIWDQTIEGNPPEGFKGGSEYGSDEINRALESENPLEIVPHMDTLGHGTGVAGIAVGNGESSSRLNTGIAPEAAIIVVKLGERGRESFARTTELMRAIKYIIDKGEALVMPISINISYGSNDGGHDGTSLFETYLNDMSRRWKVAISVASGNEGSGGRHYSDSLSTGQVKDITFRCSGGFPSMYVTMWKDFSDQLSVELIAPDGNTTGIIRTTDSLQEFDFPGASILASNRQPNHYSESQEIFFNISAPQGLLTPGIWTIRVYAGTIINGMLNIWLPTLEEVSTGTAFSIPSTDTTLTLPASAKNVISVGGYNAILNTTAIFSGRGYTRGNTYIKPDIAAPAVGILSIGSQSTYSAFTGTSFAVPFVTGSVALMMEWGIVNGNDPFLFGERVKAFLKRGAKRDDWREYPNPEWGYGTLCLRNTLSLLENYGRADYEQYW